VCTGTLVHYEQTVRGGGCGECVRVHRYTMSKQSGKEDTGSLYGYTGTLRANSQGRMMGRVCTGTPVHYEQTVRGGGCGECVRVYRYTMSKQSGKRNRRVCTGIPVHYEQTARGGGCGEWVRVHRYTMSKQSGGEDAASVYGYTGTL